MGFGDDEDILQDFLVEAGEILERLSQQLVDLEQRPDDANLLNAIFRGFHTVKGGAGFLQLTPMVECCHVTENLFDILRNGKRSVTPELMDVVLQALDTVNQQFDLVSQHEELPPVDPALLAALERLVSGDDLQGTAVAEAAHAVATTTEQQPEALQPEALPSSSVEGDITDEEFEQLLDAINDASAAAQPPAISSATDDISEDEFEALLDQLHGQGKAPGVKPLSKATPATSASSASVTSASTSSSSDEITDEEFEALLDQLHGKGQGPGKEPGKEPDKVSETAAAQPAATPTGKPATGAASAQSDLIDDDEFEALLDQLHGKGKAPNAAKVAAKPAAVPVASRPAPAAASPTAVNTQAPASPPAKPVPKDADKPVVKAAPARPSGDKETAAAETTVRVDTQRLDDIMNMVGELVLVRNRLVRLGNMFQDEALGKAVANLDVVTADLQTSVMKTRMQPIKKVFGRFPRVVRDLARSLKKEIQLDLIGEETDLDKNLVEALADPLVHLVRNSVDHGVELPDEREAKGKPRVGKVTLAAEQEGDHILLSISDDGAGMDPDKLRRLAVEKGLYDEDTAARLSDTEAFGLIFAPGFSTKKEISDVSGRGVGMDVVKTKIAQLNGTVEIQSVLGQGTRLIIKVPLTLAIMPTLMIMLGRQTFALPLASVNEIFHMDLRKSHIVDGQECIAIRDQAIPLFYLKKWLVRDVHNDSAPEYAHVVILTVGTRRVGFVVDQLIGQEEVVIKPLGKLLQGTPGMAGATITGDGTIALILDVPSLLRRYARGTASWGPN
jgi:two-component system chemotaxis sensor kinase CheA